MAKQERGRPDVTRRTQWNDCKKLYDVRARVGLLSFEYLDWKSRRGGWRFAGSQRRWGDGRNLGPLNRVFREIYEIRTDKVGNKSRAPEKDGKTGASRGTAEEGDLGGGRGESGLKIVVRV